MFYFSMSLTMATFPWEEFLKGVKILVSPFPNFCSDKDSRKGKYVSLIAGHITTAHPRFYWEDHLSLLPTLRVVSNQCLYSYGLWTCHLSYRLLYIFCAITANSAFTSFNLRSPFGEYWKPYLVHVNVSIVGGWTEQKNCGQLSTNRAGEYER